MKYRINKYLSLCGIASRRGAEKIVESGRVTLNGKRVSDLATLVDETKDKVRIDGYPLKLNTKKIYVLFNKPKGCVTTAQDPKGRKTVFDLVHIKERVFSVGRLDLNSEGLLLLTNDGELANRLMHPRYKVSKTYRVKLDREFQPDDFEPLTSGLELEDGMTAPCHAQFYTDSPDRIEIRIHEGRNRQVRRMFENLGYDVKSLKRIQYGPLQLADLSRGRWRFLKPVEIKHLKQVTSL